MASAIGSFAGIGSGFDYRDLVDEIILAESHPIQAAKSRIDLANSQLTAYSSYRNALKNLESAISSLRDGSVLQGASTTVGGAVNSSGKTLLSASAAAGATPGVYSIKVLQTAQNHKVSTASFASVDSALGLTGDLELNGVTISILATDTLEAIRDKINTSNESSSPIGISASIISDSTTSKRLVLSSTASGSEGISFDELDGVVTALGLNTIVEGKDAIFSLDGVEIVRSSNIVTDVIANMTITLSEADPTTTVSVQVERSLAYAESAINSFVDAYNQIVDFIKTQQTPGAAGKNPALYNNPTLRLARAALPSAIMEANLDVDALSLTGLGVSLTKEGKLALDSTVFREKFNGDISGVRNALQTVGDSLGTRLESWIGTGGTLSLNEQALNSRIESQQKYMDRMNDRLELRKQILLKQFLAMDVTVSKLNSQGSAFLSAITASQNNNKN